MSEKIQHVAAVFSLVICAAICAQDTMSEFPVRGTFIHFNSPLPATRSASAPPGTCVRSDDSGVRVTMVNNLTKVSGQVRSSL